jgi:DNA-binding transcriptional MerR regulator
MAEPWTIGELAERAADVLGTDSQVSGRVRDVPNERLIRWYATIGLVDPPITRRGRIALYGRRHLLQLVAIKRRQAAGLSIAAIQAELAGATDAALQAIARLPGTETPATEPPDVAVRSRHAGRLPAAAPAASVTPAGTAAALEAPAGRPGATTGELYGDGRIEPPLGAMEARSRDRFWTATTTADRHTTSREPAAAGRTPTLRTADPVAGGAGARAAADGDAETLVGGDDGTTTAQGRRGPIPDVVHGVRLAPGVTLILEGFGHAPSNEDMAELFTAARPLLAALAARGLGPDTKAAIGADIGETTRADAVERPHPPGRPQASTDHHLKG